MGFRFELYLTKKEICEKDWERFIETISKYNGIFQKWTLLVVIRNHTFHFYIKTKCMIPPSLSDVSCFLIKETNQITIWKSKRKGITLKQIDSNIIDIINRSETKEENLKMIEISFRKTFSNAIISNTYLYKKKRGYIRKYYWPNVNPTRILTISFENNSRFFYKKAPKYLDIQKIIPILSSKKDTALWKVDTYPFLSGNHYVKTEDISFDKHSVVLGASGSGKSKWLSLLMYNLYKNQEMRKKYRIVVIDPHASLENEIGGLSKVVNFDNKNNSINLFSNDNDNIVSTTELLLDLYRLLLGDSYNSKVERVLKHTIYLLLFRKQFNLENIKKILTDSNYQNTMIQEDQNIPLSIIEFFLSDYHELKTKSYTESISPILSLLDELEMTPIYHQEKLEISLQECIEKNFITLFSLNRNHLGEKGTKTISGLIMQQMFTLIQKQTIKEHIIFIIDEVSIIETPILQRFLSEARKYNLSIILSGQYLNQVSTELKNAVFSNVSNYILFRLSRSDATTLVDNLDWKIPTNNIKEEKIKMLTELNLRECLIKIETKMASHTVFKGITMNFKKIPRVVNKNIPKVKITNQNPNKPNNTFIIEPMVNLKDILKQNSTSRKRVIE